LTTPLDPAACRTYNTRMLELSEQNVVEYLRARGAATGGQILIQSLSGGIANVVLKIFDAGAGEKVGTDMHSAAKIKRGDPDTRMNRGACFVLKQPLEKFRTAAEWIVDKDRILVERDCINLLAGILPAGSVPEVLWFEDANHVLAISCAPTDSVIWKKLLLQGKVSNAVAQQAGMLLAMMHSATRGDAAVQQRYGNPKFFMQQRTEPYLAAVAAKHPDIATILNDISRQLLEAKQCLIHGDYSPKNIFVVPAEAPPQPDPSTTAAARPATTFSHLLLLDFEVAFFGHPAFDVATLINHLLLKGFVAKSRWRPYVIAADAFLQTYEQAVDKPLAAATDALGGQLLAALLLARLDGKSPAEYLTDETLKHHIRTTAKSLLPRHLTLLETLDEVSVALADWSEKK
jgi:hypothetical protein